MPTWGEILDQIEEGRERIGLEAYDVVRKKYIDDLADYTGNDVILYSSSWTAPSDNTANQSIDDSDIQGFMEALSGLDGDTLDLVIHSPGGKPEAAEQIVEYLRDNFDEIRAFVPQSARSAATLVCCAADVVYMGSHSSLGPIDPQLRLRTDLGPRMVPAHSILEQFDMARNEFKETGEVGHWAPILRQYGPSLIRECEDAIDYSEQLAKRWAEEFQVDTEDAASELAENLSERKEHKSHNRPIMRDEAEEIGFNVEPLEQDDDLQDHVLSVFHAAGHTHSGTGAAKIIENHAGNSFVRIAGQPESEDDE
ncbi:serine protease [Natronomonas halophila]|uniref:SDH family Clp fold serine proteinase n=1 Tax=Natronomonas halophila TaxID=2747817 RepID=UPI0015B59137|nr:serine protease [Natronomonas halophila]QLD84599.1 serine protease [Natronomonas halophila]QLD84655.1 serine protease [Natronomonas halophila]